MKQYTGKETKEMIEKAFVTMEKENSEHLDNETNRATFELIKAAYTAQMFSLASEIDRDLEVDSLFGNDIEGDIFKYVPKDNIIRNYIKTLDNVNGCIAIKAIAFEDKMRNAMKIQEEFLEKNECTLEYRYERSKTMIDLYVLWMAERMLYLPILEY